MAERATSPPGSGSRRAMTIGLVVLGLVIVGLIVGIAVASSDTTSARHPAATTTTTTTAAATTTTTATVGADPQGYAVALYNSWKAGDRVAAAHVASAQAVDEMFAVPYQAQPSTNGPVDPYSFQGCHGAAGSTICAWQAPGIGTIMIRVRNPTGGLPVVVVDLQRGGP